jgi:hypothetical protein
MNIRQLFVVAVAVMAVACLTTRVHVVHAAAADANVAATNADADAAAEKLSFLEVSGVKKDIHVVGITPFLLQILYWI